MDIENREKLHSIEKEIIVYYIQICEKLGLKYTILGGTLLGAVRHKNFIPWDDDVDFGMPRPDYEKLINYLIKHDNKSFPFKNFRNSDIKTYFSRIENKKAKIIDRSAEKKDERNAWIDIFPLDGMPSNKLLLKAHQVNLLRLRLLLQYSQFSDIVNVSLTERPIVEKIFIKLGELLKPERFLNTHKIMIKLDKSLKKYTYENSLFAVNFMGAYKFREMFDRNVYEDLVLYSFDDIQLFGPREYDLVLSQLYGKKYMLPPSKMVMNKHFTEIVINDGEK